MKKFIISVFCLFSVVLIATAENSREFFARFAKTLEHNQQFANPNLVYPGDTVFVPIIIQEKSVLGGHDCIWKAVKRTETGNAPMLSPVSSSRNNQQPRLISPEESIRKLDWLDIGILSGLLAIIVLLVIACLLRRPVTTIINNNANPVNPVMPQNIPQPTPPVNQNVDIEVIINGQEVSIHSQPTTAGIRVRVNLTQN